MIFKWFSCCWCYRYRVVSLFGSERRYAEAAVAHRRRDARLEDGKLLLDGLAFVLLVVDA